MKPEILIIDDEHDLLTFLNQVLVQEGYHVLTAISGEKGVTVAREVQPDLILLDIMMPGMDGWEVLDLLRSSEETQSIPVVMLSARTDPQSKWEGWQQGAVDFITKPFSLPNLLLRIREILAQVTP